MHYKLVIKNGLVFDGSGAPAQLRNVGISHGTVQAIAVEPLVGEREIDARDCRVTPGFIDYHTH